MQLKNSILEKITYLNDLLIKIDRYWAKVEITKATKKKYEKIKECEYHTNKEKRKIRRFIERMETYE